MNRDQLDMVVTELYKLKDIRYVAPECLVTVLWRATADPRSSVLCQLYRESEKFKACINGESDEWPGPENNYPRTYYLDALHLMDSVRNKEPWQKNLCEHFAWELRYRRDDVECKEVDGDDGKTKVSMSGTSNISNTIDKSDAIGITEEKVETRAVDKSSEVYEKTGTQIESRDKSYTVYRNGILKTTCETVRVFIPYC